MIDDRHENPDDVMARAFAPPPDLSTLQARLLRMADLLEAKLRAAGMFDGPDGREVFDLREAATRAAHYDSVVSAWDAHKETMGALGQHLLDAHKPGEVDEGAVAILDGYHVGARPIATGEQGETTLEAALRLLKLAHQRGAFAPAEHVVSSAHAPAGATFRVAMIDSLDAIPEWAKSAWPTWPSETAFSNDRTEQRSCIAILHHEKVEFYWDGGEPEDNTFGRDWAWVPGTISSAYEAGLRDAHVGAVPATWRQICDKIKALGLRCYIRGGEGVETALMIDGPAVYYAPEGINKAPVGKRIADIHDSTTALFTPRLVDGHVVPFERLTADVMTIPLEDFIDARLLRVRLSDLDTGGDFLGLGRDRGELVALRWALGTVPAKETP